MPEKSTRESDPTPSRPSGPSDSQIDAAIEGARGMVESRQTANDDRGNAERGGAGAAQGGGTGSARGIGSSTAGAEMPHDPSVETGGPPGVQRDK